MGKCLLACAVLLVAVVFASSLSGDVLAVLERFSDLGDGTFGGRIGFYKLCLSLWSQHPVFGCGWDSYTEAFSITGEGREYAEVGLVGMDAHNVYLQVLAEEGLVGVVLIVGVIIGGIVDAVRRLVAVNRLEASGSGSFARERSVIAGSLAIQLFFVMYCMVGNPLYDIQMYVPWVLSLGMSCAATPHAAEALLAARSHAGRVRPSAPALAVSQSGVL